jgi:ABC-type branched-subunit amino acid transport system ATPase component/ABC-type branched-subunit amino acid transport system permease subunit
MKSLNLPIGSTGISLIRVILPLMVIYLLPVIFADEFFILMLQTVGYTYIVVMGLDVLVGFTGQKSLGHAGFFAVGAYTSALLTTKLGFSFWITLPLAAAFSGLFGVILALTSFRARGLHLAMVTIAFGLIIQILATRWINLTNGPMGIFGIPPPSFHGKPLSTQHYFYLIGSIAFLLQIGAFHLLSSRFGRTLLALKDSEIAAETVGVNVYRWKTFAFVFSSIYAGIGGVLFAHQSGFINSESFGFMMSVSFLAATLLGGSGTLLGPLVGTVIFVLLPQIFAALYNYYLMIVGLILFFAIFFLKEGIVGTLSRLPYFSRFPAGKAKWGRPEISSPLHSPRSEGTGVVMEIQGLSKHFGGVKAVDQLEWRMKSNHIYGLIGPNGSGKSTLVNVLTGVYERSGGKVFYRGDKLPNLTPHKMAQKGVTRTFQSIQLFSNLTVLENILVGFHTRMKAGFFSHLLRSRKAVLEEEKFRGEALSILDLLGLREKAHEKVKNFPYGHQRLVEIGRALALKPNFLFLDEPAAGMNSGEIQQLSQIIRKLPDLGVSTIVVIEHHMELVMEIADSILVLNFGEKIAEGGVYEIRQNPKVIEAYLGDEKVIFGA